MKRTQELDAPDFEGFLLEQLPALLLAAQSGDSHRTIIMMRRLVAHLRDISPRLADQLNRTLFHSGSGVMEIAARGERTAVLGPPVDEDSSAPLVRTIDCTSCPEPVLPDFVRGELAEVVSEHAAVDMLLRADLQPRCTILLIGPPGVGKTMLAKWLAAQLRLPLAQAELSATVSSFLGRTGQNLKGLLDYARMNRVVLLLDEFDAIAKRRDDQTDLGELKRIVSVLLKELEEWPGPSVIVAATNHEDLIDPAIFRRFNLILRLSFPDSVQSNAILRLHLGTNLGLPGLSEFAGELLAGSSGSNIRDLAHEIRRDVLLGREISTESALLKKLAARCEATERRRRFCEMAQRCLPPRERSYAQLAQLLSVSKSTIHNYLKGETGAEGS